MKHFFALFLLFGGCGLCAAQSPSARALTLAEATTILRQQSPVLIAARAHSEAVRASEITAGLRPNPLFSSANEDFNVFNPSKLDPVDGQEYTENISQLIELGHKRQYRIQSAKLGTLVAQDTYRDLERQVLLQLRQAFVGMLLAKSNLGLAEDNLKDYKETVRLNEVRYEAGDISGTDFSRIKLQQSRFESDLLNAQLALSQVRTQVQQLLGYTVFRPDFDIAGELDAKTIAADLASLQRIALANRPDYLAALDSVRKAQADANLAAAQGTTDLTVGGEYKRNGPDNTLGVTFQLPLRVFDRNQGEKLRTSRELDASRAAELAAKAQVLSDVDQAYRGYQSALARVELYKTDYLQRAKDVRDHLAFSYRNGGASLLDYLDAVRDYRDTELAWRSANAQLLNAIYQLSFVTGSEIQP